MNNKNKTRFIAIGIIATIFILFLSLLAIIIIKDVSEQELHKQQREQMKIIQDSLKSLESKTY